MHPFPLAFHCRRCILGIVISTEKVHRSLVGGCLYVVDSEDSTTSSIRRMANPIMQAGVMWASSMERAYQSRRGWIHTSIAPNLHPRSHGHIGIAPSRKPSSQVLFIVTVLAVQFSRLHAARDLEEGCYGEVLLQPGLEVTGPRLY